MCRAGFWCTDLARRGAQVIGPFGQPLCASAPVWAGCAPMGKEHALHGAMGALSRAVVMSMRLIEVEAKAAWQAFDGVAKLARP